MSDLPPLWHLMPFIVALLATAMFDRQTGLMDLVYMNQSHPIYRALDQHSDLYDV